MSGSGDYISRVNAIEAMFKDAEAHPDHTFWTTQHEALLNIPAADVRPVVLCRDCIFRSNEWTGCPKLNGTITYDEFFCKCGIKREKS